MLIPHRANIRAKTVAGKMKSGVGVAEQRTRRCIFLRPSSRKKLKQLGFGRGWGVNLDERLVLLTRQWGLGGAGASILDGICGWEINKFSWDENPLPLVRFR